MDKKVLFVAGRGAIVATLFVALWVWIAALVHRLDPVLGVALPGWLRPLGWILLAAGAAFGLACVWLFLTVGKGTPAPFDPPQVFVAIGPYRYVRNPMYVGGIAAMAGVGLIVPSCAILILAVLVWGFVQLMVVYYEEPDLKKRFGNSYVEYTGRVHRWLPRLPS
ncbi:MAG TPA: isoprenylcysteine carboxylmethyltransferase family protein [bacterium]|nr:isoprenylcysteine carboxylmethyltransferase family protein [bacterium]HPR87571.1 isoprenylcysteine carboxylmethyltransferase family protein [bacterium]